MISLLGGGAVGYWLYLRSERKQAQKLKKSSLEEVFKSDKKNYELPYTIISEVELKKLSKMWWPYHVEVLIHTEKKKRKYRLKDINLEQISNLLGSVIPEKITIK